MTTLLITVIAVTCALAAVAAVQAARQQRPLLWRKILAVLGAEYSAGVVLGCWPVDAVLAPARTILDRLLVGGA